MTCLIVDNALIYKMYRTYGIISIYYYTYVLEFN